MDKQRRNKSNKRNILLITIGAILIIGIVLIKKVIKK